MSYKPGSHLTVSSILPGLIIKIVGILSAVTIVIGIFLAYLDHSINLRTIKDKAGTNADYFANSLSYPVWNLVYREINTQLEGFFIDPEAFSVSLVLEGVDEGVIQLTRDADWQPVFGPADQNESVISEFRDIIANNEVVATLEINYTLRFVMSKIKIESIIFILIVLILDSIIIFSLLIILRIDVFRPLRRIERWAAGVSSGKNSEDLVNELFYGEINSLSHSIERMKIQLEERIRITAATEHKYRTLFVNSPVATWEFDFSPIIEGKESIIDMASDDPESLRQLLYDTDAKSANPVALSIFGVDNAESSFTDLVDGADNDTLSVFASELTSLVNAGTDVGGEGGIRMSYGEQRFFIFRFAGLREASNPYGRVLLAALDVTEKVEAYTELHTALTGKEMLANELFHRIGNTLQLVESLICLSESRSDNEVEELTGLKLRIQAIAATQTKLYESEDLSVINLRSLFSDLASTIISSVSGNSSGIKILIDMAETEVLIDVAVPLALVLGELAANTAKYAFPENREGLFSVSLKRNNDNQIILLIWDDGIGPPPNFNPSENHAMGLSIVTQLIEGQLGGRIEFDFSEGFKVEIHFDDSLFSRRV